MVLAHTVRVELIKIKGSSIKYILSMPLFLSFMMMITDLYLGKEKMIGSYKKVTNDGFVAFVIENHILLLWPAILVFTIIISGVFLYYIDQRNGLLTYIFLTPVGKINFLLTKFILHVALIATLVIFESAITIVLGNFFNISQVMDVSFVVRYFWFQMIMSLGVISLQAVVFSIFEDITAGMTVHIVGICMSIMALKINGSSIYIPYLQIGNSLPIFDGNDMAMTMLVSLIWTIIFLTTSAIIFKNRDIGGK